MKVPEEPDDDALVSIFALPCWAIKDFDAMTVRSWMATYSDERRWRRDVLCLTVLWWWLRPVRGPITPSGFASINPLADQFASLSRLLTTASLDQD